MHVQTQEQEPDTEVPMWVLQAYAHRVTDVFAGRLGPLTQVTDIVRTSGRIKSVFLALLLIPNLAIAWHMCSAGRTPNGVVSLALDVKITALAVILLSVASGTLLGLAVLRLFARRWLRMEWHVITGEGYRADRTFGMLKRSARGELPYYAHPRKSFCLLRDIMVLLGRDVSYVRIEHYREREAGKKENPDPTPPDFDALARGSGHPLS